MSGPGWMVHVSGKGVRRQVEAQREGGRALSASLLSVARPC